MKKALTTLLGIVLISTLYNCGGNNENNFRYKTEYNSIPTEISNIEGTESRLIIGASNEESLSVQFHDSGVNIYYNNNGTGELRNLVNLDSAKTIYDILNQERQEVK